MDEIMENEIKDYCVVNIETSGLSKENDEIVEIGIVKVRNNKIVDTFTNIIKPQVPLKENMSKVIGMSNEILKYAETIDEVVVRVLNFIGDDIVITYSDRYNTKFIDYNCKKLGYEFNNKVIDVLPLVKELFPRLKDYKLETVCSEIEIENLKLNGIMNTAYFVMYLFELIVEKLPE